MTNSSGDASLWKTCTCNSGFHGDGFICDPDDPCQVNYGGCIETSTICVNTSPGKAST